MSCFVKQQASINLHRDLQRQFFTQMLGSVVMILGYGIIAVPTGIVTVELAQAARQRNVNTQSCPSCGAEGP